MAIIDFRNASSAVELFDGKDKARAFDALTEQPELVEALAKMHRAQSGLPLTGGSIDDDGMTLARQLQRAATQDEGADDGE